MITIVNLTPHAVTVNGEDGSVTVPPSGTVARIETVMTPAETITVDGVAITVQAQRMGEVTGLPEPVDGTVYVVSLPVAAALGASRPDVVAPGPLVRDAEGRPVACNGLVRVQ